MADLKYKDITEKIMGCAMHSLTFKRIGNNKYQTSTIPPNL